MIQKYGVNYSTLRRILATYYLFGLVQRRKFKINRMYLEEYQTIFESLDAENDMQLVKSEKDRVAQLPESPNKATDKKDTPIQIQDIEEAKEPEDVDENEKGSQVEYDD